MCFLAHLQPVSFVIRIMDGIAIPLAGAAYILNEIGFDLPIDRANIMAGGLDEFQDFRYLEEKDIRNMSDEFGKCTVAQGRITFGLGRLKRMIGVMHWIQDCYRASDIPNHLNFNDGALIEALTLANVRKTDIDLVDTNSKAINPGKFKDERKWPEWERAFENYLSVIPGVNGAPLSYVIRETEVPAPGTVYATHNKRLINRAPLVGSYFIADTRRVHTLLSGFIQGKTSENWIRSIARFQDARRDFIALRRSYAGEGNTTRRIADAKRIQSSLRYKTERALPFGKFLDSLQKMFTIFEEEGEPLTERAKVDELLSKVQCTALAAAVASLRFQLNTDGVTFTRAANHLVAAVAQTSDYQLARRISAVGTNSSGRGYGRGSGRGYQGRGGRGRGGCGGRGGGKEKSTNYYSPEEWEKLSYEESDKIRKERDKKGKQGGTKRTISEMTTKQLTTAIISSIQKATGEGESEKDKDRSAPKKLNAGDAFGGREGAKRAKPAND